MRLYITSAHEDAPVVEELARALQELGSVAVDRVIMAAIPGLPPAPGHDMRDALLTRIKGADAVVVVISGATLHNQRLAEEAYIATGYCRERGWPLVIPVVVGEAQLPSLLGEFHAVFLRNRSIADVAIDIASAVEIAMGRRGAVADQRRETQAHVEGTAAEYIRVSIQELKDRASRDRRQGYVWYVISFCSLLLGLPFGIWRMLVISNMDGQWQHVVPISVGAIVVIVLLLSVARYAFMLGKGFMVESIRLSDRIHAISYGQFCLKAFGDKVDWTEVKEACQHWNIDRGSAFLSQTAREFDPQLLEMAVRIATALSSSAAKK